MEKTARNPSWTIWNMDEYEQQTSNVAAVLGAILLFVGWESTNKKESGERHGLFSGWDSKLEPPFARPSRPEGHLAREGRQLRKDGKVISAGRPRKPASSTKTRSGSKAPAGSFQ